MLRYRLISAPLAGVTTLALVLLLPLPALAQEEGGTEMRVTGFVAPGTFVEDTFLCLRVGGMFEQVWPNGLGYAVDGSYMMDVDYPRDGIGMVSPAVLYQFRTDGPVSPYVRGGYGFIFDRYDIEGLWNLGGGANLFLKESFALKFEARYSFDQDYAGDGLFDVLIGGVYAF